MPEGGGSKVIRYALAIGVAIALSGVSANAASVAPDDVKIVDGAIAKSLTGVAGDPAKGRDWFKGRKLGNCLACHVNSDLKDQPYHGEVAPPLDGVADRWSEAELRAIVVNPKEALSEDTVMPSFYRVSGFNRVAKKFAGKTILSAQQVEDVVAYLKTLKE
jgi:sulfur-oxidizing protein SoxX